MNYLDFSSLYANKAELISSYHGFPFFFSLFFSTAPSPTPPSLKICLPCPPSISSSVEVSEPCCLRAIWAEADKSSCVGLVVPAGLPEASEACLPEVMGEICGSQGRNVMQLTCWSSCSPLCKTLVYLSVSQSCFQMALHWPECSMRKKSLFLRGKKHDKGWLWFFS